MHWCLWSLTQFCLPKRNLHGFASHAARHVHNTAHDRSLLLGDMHWFIELCLLLHPQREQFAAGQACLSLTWLHAQARLCKQRALTVHRAPPWALHQTMQAVPATCWLELATISNMMVPMKPGAAQVAFIMMAFVRHPDSNLLTKEGTHAVSSTICSILCDASFVLTLTTGCKLYIL